MRENSSKNGYKISNSGYDSIPGCDKIFLSDYVISVEIGAFESEIGKKQKIRFNVVVDVRNEEIFRYDEVEDILSYEIIIGAIKFHLSDKRINLLETLAELIAKSCLSDVRARRAKVRIEKLDRVPGSLGVEIVRLNEVD